MPWRGEITGRSRTRPWRPWRGGGDQEAFGALYERHFDALYDFAYRIVRTTDGAADVVQHTLARGWERFREGAVPDNVKAWMYVVARNAAIDEVRRGRRAVPVPEAAGEGEPPSPLERLEAGPGPDVDPEAAARARELVQLVWEAADGLGDEQRSLLHLQVRQELSADELADHLGVKKGALYTRLSRLRDAFEEALVALILLRHGRRDCPELDAMLTEMRAVGPSPEVRTAIQAHLEDCRRCQESKRGLVAASEILAAVPPVAVPAALRDRVWGNVTATAEVPKRPRRGRAARVALAAAALAAVVGGSVGGFLLLSAGGPDVRDPGLRSPNPVGVPSDDNTIVVQLVDPDSRAGAYSTLWTKDPGLLPDTNPEPVEGNRITSPKLANGSWHFVIRTRENGADGEWTSTASIGPFVVEGAEPPVEDELRCGSVQTVASWDGLLQVEARLTEGREAEITIESLGAIGQAQWDRFVTGGEVGISFRGREVTSGTARPGEPLVLRATLPVGRGMLEVQHIGPLFPGGAFTFASLDCRLDETVFPLEDGPIGGFQRPEA